MTRGQTSPFPPGADGPRPLPRAMRARLVDEMVEAGLGDRLRGADTPRAMPLDLVDRLEATVVGAAGAAPLPVRLRRRIERRITDAPPTRAVLAAAAVVILVLGSLSVASLRDTSSTRGTDLATAPTTTPPERPPDGSPGGQAGSAAGGTVTTAPSAGGRIAPMPGGSVGGAPSAPPSAGVPQGPAPPFAFPSPCGDAVDCAVAPSQPAGPKAPPPEPRPALRVGVVGSGTPADVGLRAYIDRLNAAGGVRYRSIDLVATSASSPAPGVIAVVNVGAEPVATNGGAPAWVAGPLLEAPGITEDRLAGTAYSFSSVLERQAHIAVRQAFVDPPQPGERAVVYRAAAGPYAGRVSAAFEDELAELGVLTVVTTFNPASPVLLPGDAAFVSMPTAEARPLLDHMNAQSHAPARGVWGVASLFDEALIPSIGDGVRIASPYRLSGRSETDTLRSAAGGSVDAERIHGWVTAKALAVAIWNTDASTPGEMLAAMDSLANYRNGFMDPYEVRPGTRSRTPEAVVMRVTAGAFSRLGEFLRDP